MKYIIVLSDGMADEPIEELRGRTPLEVAETEYMDAMAPYFNLCCSPVALGMGSLIHM